MEKFEKRGQFCVRENGVLRKFQTLEARKEFLGETDKPAKKDIAAAFAELKAEEPEQWNG